MEIKFVQNEFVHFPCGANMEIYKITLKTLIKIVQVLYFMTYILLYGVRKFPYYS